MLTVDGILKEVHEDASRKYDNPIDRLASNSDKALRYSELLFRVNRQKNKQKVLVEKKYSELYNSAKFDSHLLLKTKQDVESHICINGDYNKMKHALDELENLSQMLTNLVWVYQQREASERLIFKLTTGIGG
jgi:hypothetical protein